MFSHFHHEILQAVGNIFFSWWNLSLTAFGWFQALTFLLTFRKIIINFLFPCQGAFWWFVLFLFPRPQCCLLLTFFSSLRSLVPSRLFFFRNITLSSHTFYERNNKSQHNSISHLTWCLRSTFFFTIQWEQSIDFCL